jgi:hypothetical protein
MILYRFIFSIELRMLNIFYFLREIKNKYFPIKNISVLNNY